MMKRVWFIALVFFLVPLASSSSASSLSLFNDQGRRFAFVLASSNTSNSFPNGAVLFNEGGGQPLSINVGPSDFIWRVNNGTALYTGSYRNIMVLYSSGDLNIFGRLNASTLTGSLLYEYSNETRVYTGQVMIKRFNDLHLQDGNYTVQLSTQYAGITEDFQQPFEVKNSFGRKLVEFFRRFFV